MSTAPTPTITSNGATSAQDIFALTDEQILQIEPDAQDLEIFVGERSDQLDPLREDLDLLASAATSSVVQDQHQTSSHSDGDGLKAVATNANATPTMLDAQAAPSPNANVTSTDTTNAAPPAWLAERMNDPQHGAEARELWQATQAANQEASAFRQVFAKPDDARAAATRARMLDEIDSAYFGAPGIAPEQVSASRVQLAALMMREDPAAFREMVFAGLRALEAAGHAAPEQGSAAQLPRLAQAFRNQSPESTNASGAPVAPPFRAASSAAANTDTVEPPRTTSSTQQGDDGLKAVATNSATASQAHQATTPAHQTISQANQRTPQQDARLAAYAAFERAANDELERGVVGAIDRSLQQALPNAARSENGAALKTRLSSAIRQDVERALQGDRALGEQVARILAGQRLDAAARAQVVRLIGERAQQLIPTAARRVLADWTQTTLSAHATHANRGAATVTASHARASSASASSPLPTTTNRNAATPQTQSAARDAARHTAAAPTRGRKFDYRQLSDEQILDL